MQWGEEKNFPGILSIGRRIPIPGGPAVVMDRGQAERLYASNQAGKHGEADSQGA